jgi:hypothetical protein
MKYLVTYSDKDGNYCEDGPLPMGQAFDLQQELKKQGCVDVELHDALGESEK